jgi:lactoylglutathione lyase
MRIDHIALWTTDLERCKQFYGHYFGAVAGAIYVNAGKGFTSCFLSFSDGARIEVMKTTMLAPVTMEPGAQRMGLTLTTASPLSMVRAARVTDTTRVSCSIPMAIVLK